MDFGADSTGLNFNHFTTTLTQDGKSVSMTGDCDDLINMNSDIWDGMTFAFSSWGTDYDWL